MCYLGERLNIIGGRVAEMPNSESLIISIYVVTYLSMNCI